MLTESKIKENLIDKIRNTEDVELLSQISRLIDLEVQVEEVYQFSAEQLKVVNEGLAQIDRGEFISNEESNRQADQWLKR